MRFCYLEKDRVLNPKTLNTLGNSHLSLHGV